MAELPLAIGGILLAWKGLIDFGTLIHQLLDDSTRQRDILAIKLEASQFTIEDWGKRWEIDQDPGRFHSLEPHRKVLITRILFRLCESRSAAVQRLTDRYGLPAGDEIAKKNSGKGLSKTVDRVLGAATKAKEKSLWLVHDKMVLGELVTETMELFQVLQSLTSLSDKFLYANLTVIEETQPLGSGLFRLEQDIREQSRRTEPNNGEEGLAENVDDQTLAAFASKAITSSEQQERVQHYINQSFHRHGDTRIAEVVGGWWNDPEAGVMILEVSDNSEDRSSTAASVLLYYIADCRKLIYVFESESGRQPLERGYAMMRTLTQDILTLRENQPLPSGLSLPINIADMEHAVADKSSVQRLVKFFLQLLHDVLSHSDGRVLLIIDGLELSGFDLDDDLGEAMSSFVSGLHALCLTPELREKAILKVLIGHNGHATRLYDCVGVTDAVDLTDAATQTSCMFDDMGQTIHD